MKAMHTIMCSIMVLYLPLKAAEVSEKNLSYPYVRVSSSLALQTIGAGYRFRNPTLDRGHDGSVFLSTILFMQGSMIPSVRYSMLFYKESTVTSRYFGVGIECFFPRVKSWDYERQKNCKSYKILPNIALIWGKEHGRYFKYSQFEWNVLPTVLLAFDWLDHVRSNHPYSYGHSSGLICLPFAASFAIAF